jgi:GAF domain-containing protein
LETQTTSALEKLLDELEKQTDPPSTEQLDRVSETIAKIFRLKADEVAVLEILPPGKLLRFVLPEKLRGAGSIPLNSNSALAARTARLRRADIVNNFPSFRHATVFEGFPLGRRYDESIQKILSAPIVRDNRVIGVVQLCRKGISALDAGPDFTASDLADLKNISDLLTRFLTFSRPTS